MLAEASLAGCLCLSTQYRLLCHGGLCWGCMSSEFSIPALRVSSKQLTLTLEVLVLAPSLSPQKGSMNDFQEQVGFTLSSNGPQIVCGVKHQGPWSQLSSPAMPPGIPIMSTCTGDDSSKAAWQWLQDTSRVSHIWFQKISNAHTRITKCHI